MLDHASETHQLHNSINAEFVSFEHNNKTFTKEIANQGLFDQQQRKKLKVEVYNKLGILYQALKEYDIAIDYYAKSWELDHENLIALYNSTILKYKLSHTGEKKYTTDQIFTNWSHHRKLSESPSNYQQKLSEINSQLLRSEQSAAALYYHLDILSLRCLIQKQEDMIIIV